MQTTNFIAGFILLILIDLPFLLTMGQDAIKVAETIQHKPVRFRILSAAVVYIAMTYLLFQTKSTAHAFAMGMAVYAVYDFTTHSILTEYPLHLAIIDTIWGGILFASVYTIMKTMNKI
jgi:uncharacterized membrane protein